MIFYALPTYAELLARRVGIVWRLWNSPLPYLRKEMVGLRANRKELSASIINLELQIAGMEVAIEGAPTEEQRAVGREVLEVMEVLLAAEVSRRDTITQLIVELDGVTKMWEENERKWRNA